MRKKIVFAAAVISAFAAFSAGTADAQKILKHGSFAPGLSPYTVNTAWATMANKYVDGVEVQIIATGAATRHQLLGVQNKMDFFMMAPITYWLLYNQKGPFKKIKNGPELIKNHCGVFSYELGPYHFTTYAADGMRKLEDIKGKKVFIGPPGGSATRTVGQMIKQHSGLVAGTDFEQAKLGWGAALQAFQDRKIDVLVVPTNFPSPGIQQIALTNKLYFLSLEKDKIPTLPIAKQIGRTVVEIPADAYGDNQINTETVHTFGATVGLGTRCSMDDDTIYKITKAFWEHLDEVHAMAPWAKNTLTLERSLHMIPEPIHPGAMRYYNEIGAKTSEFKLKK